MPTPLRKSTNTSIITALTEPPDELQMNKLGIIVVYFLDDNDIDILDLHLQSITQHTKSDYTIFGVANRVSHKIKDHLDKYNDLELVSIEKTNAVGSEEHSYYLDKLITHAISNGQATHICTFDCDSFPIKDNWEKELYQQLSKQKPVIAISRKENGDNFLPHPSMTFFSATFYLHHPFNFFPSLEEIKKPKFQAFLLEKKQNIDSGIGLAYLLYSNKISWTPLIRSNKKDDHYLLAGIYGNMIFHLGSMSWSNRDFRKDRSLSKRIQLAVFIRNKIIHCPAGSFRKKILDLIEKSALNNIKKRNNDTYIDIRKKLASNPYSYFKYLKKQD